MEKKYPYLTFSLVGVVVIVQEEVSVAPPESTAVAGRHPLEGVGGGVPLIQALRPAGGHCNARGRRLWTRRTGETSTTLHYTQRSHIRSISKPPLHHPGRLPGGVALCNLVLSWQGELSDLTVSTACCFKIYNSSCSGIPVNRGAALTSLTCDSGKLADPFGAHGESSSPCPVNARSHQNLFTAPTLRKTFWRVYPPVHCNPELTLWGLDEDLGQAGVLFVVKLENINPKVKRGNVLNHPHLLNVSGSHVSVRLLSLNLQVKVKEQDVTFALKVIKKKHVVDNRQEEHIHSERKILAEARSPFVVKSVTFQPFKQTSVFSSLRSIRRGKPGLLIKFLFDHS